MSQDVYNIATLVGTFLSLSGVVIAIFQIRKALTAAQAAERSAAATERVINRNVFLADVSTCVTAIEEVKVLLRSARFEAALLRVTDLNSDLIHLLHLPGAFSDAPQDDFKVMLTQLAILREGLEQKVQAEAADLNPVQANSVLANISDQLNHWIGGAKYVAGSGSGNHGS